MVVAPCIISFALGLVSIDMFFDHYTFVSPSLNSAQVTAGTSYYENAFSQPWYTSLITLVPILIGAIVMLRNARRTIYDTISVPLFIVVVGLFQFQVKKYIALLATEKQASHSAKEGYLRQIANNHAIIGVLLIGLLILQVLAERKPSKPLKKVS